MAIDVVMPKMGESVQEGKITKWLKKPGDRIQRDDVLCEIATDKVDTEVPSADEGILIEILVKEGETVAVGTVIARIGSDVAQVKSAAPTAPKPDAAKSTAPIAPPAPATPAPVNTTSSATKAPAEASGASRVEIVMPKMGESVQEGTITKWLKKAGDKIEQDEALLEISTDKVDTEVPSPAAGILQEILVKEGATVAVGTVMAYVSSSTAAVASTPPAAAPVSSSNVTTASAVAQKPSGSNGATASPVNAPTPPAISAAGTTPPRRMSGKRFYSPLVRTIATTEKISLEELDAIPGTGIEGRVTKNDLLGYMKIRTAQPGGAALGAPAVSKSDVQRNTPVLLPGEEAEVVEMDHIRHLIAEHMVMSKRTSPHVTAVHECDVTKIEKFRAEHKDAFKSREGVSLTPTPFFVRAVAQALREFPYVNASVDGTKIYLKKHINIGIATALPDGNLIVPVLRDADGLSLAGIARGIADLANRARTRKLKPDEIQYGTFTITNYGIFGSLFGAPIINQPQVAILGTGAIQKRPVVRELEGTDYIIIRSMCYLSLSHDHRLVDGMLGGKFMSRIVEILESFDPSKENL